MRIYCDGSSHSRRDLPGGWAYIVLVRQGSSKSVRILSMGYGGHPKTSNNEMELTAALRGMKAYEALCEQDPFFRGLDATVVSDSQYTIGVASGRNRILANVELATELRQICALHKVKSKWIRGHAGNPWNERCDRFAKRGKEEAIQALQSGG